MMKRKRRRLKPADELYARAFDVVECLGFCTSMDEADRKWLRPTLVKLSKVLRRADACPDGAEGAVARMVGGRAMSDPLQNADQHFEADAIDEARALLTAWVACCQQPRPRDWELICKHLLEDTERFLEEAAR